MIYFIKAKINIKYFFFFFLQIFHLFLVSTDIANKGAWKECFSVKEIKLPTGYYFGVTATTGDLTDNHEILSIRLFELDLPNDVSVNLYLSLNSLEFYSIDGLFIYLFFFFQPKDEEDRSKIIPSATYFESPRGVELLFYYTKS